MEHLTEISLAGGRTPFWPLLSVKVLGFVDLFPFSTLLIILISFSVFSTLFQEHFPWWGRGADGRAVLRSSVREFLASEVAVQNVRLLMCQNPSEFVRFFLCFLWLKWFKLKAFCKLQGVLFFLFGKLLLIFNETWLRPCTPWEWAQHVWDLNWNCYVFSVVFFQLLSVTGGALSLIVSQEARCAFRVVLPCVWCTSRGNCRPTLANGSDGQIWQMSTCFIFMFA